MKKIKIDATSKTPKVVLDYDKALIELRGRSIPENALEFYTPIYEWMDEYTKQPKELMNVNVKLEYFNTSSSKCILNFFKKLEKMIKDGINLKVNWIYDHDDEDMYEVGLDFQSMVDIKFNMLVDNNTENNY